jgi:beta-glucanase (GH16 family)
MARSRRILVLGVVAAVGAGLLAAAIVGLVSVADGAAESTTAVPQGPTGPLRDRVLDGTPAPRPDHYDLAFEEEFDDDLDSDVWGTCHWWQAIGCTIESNDERQLYYPANVEVDDGVVRLEARQEPVEDKDGEKYPYTSGMVTTAAPRYEEDARYAFTYGYVEARLRLPEGQGLWPAFWLLPASQESRPEIDVLETLGHRPDRAELHYHYVDADGEEASVGTDWTDRGLADGDWHEVAVHWSPGRITWIIDGQARWEVTGDEVSDEPMYLVLNLAVGGEWPGDPDETTDFPALVEADWIRVWQDPALGDGS